METKAAVAETDTTADTVVSVVLATNRAGRTPFLDAAVASVLAQRHSRLELFIVDDGSPDPDAIGRLVSSDPRIRSTRVDGIGVAGARNVGVSLTGGSVLAFIDDDDVWDPERLARHLVVMEADPEIAVSYCRMRTIDSSGNELAPADQTPIHGIHDVYRRTTGILMGNTVLRRDALISAGGFNPVFQIAEDLDLLLRLAGSGRVAFVDGPALVDYRAHENSTTQDHRKVAESVRTVLRLHRWAVLQRGRPDLAADLAHSLAANERYAAWSAARAARRSARSGHLIAAARELVWAIRFAPGVPLNWASHRFARRRSGSA
ncbi:MAG: glycosyltransferase family 2 protein [Microbacteriaceae bacterium]|nr:MAG: glycosyltransferase family 2 protein [Microbacteriaceae bacterium]